jgi:thiamine-phosphate pyrophosphorylase
MRLDLRVYLVTGDAALDEAVDIVSAAVAGGVTAVQYRHKHEDTHSRRARAGRLVSVTEPAGVPLLINDDVGAAQISGISGVHLGPDDMNPAHARAALGPNAVIGWSIHSMDQLQDHDAISASDYLAASPVWETMSKLDTTEPWGLDGVRTLRAAMPKELPLIGIGGINTGNASDLVAAGADGVAVVSAIWNSRNPEQATRQLRETVDSALAVRATS